MKTIVIGLGNPILGDDGVGWVVAEEISKLELCKSKAVIVDCLSVGGMTLMEHLVGFDRAIIIDALQTSLHPIGTVIKMKLEDFPEQIAAHLTSAHDVNLKTALQLGREMGAQLPEEIIFIGIAAEYVTNFSNELSPTIQNAIPQAVERISNLLCSVG